MHPALTSFCPKGDVATKQDSICFVIICLEMLSLLLKYPDLTRVDMFLYYGRLVGRHLYSKFYIVMVCFCIKRPLLNEVLTFVPKGWSHFSFGEDEAGGLYNMYSR